MRFVEELEGDVVDRPLVDAREAVGPGAKPVFLGMVDDGVGGSGRGRLGIVFLQYYRHPSTVTLPQPRSTTIGEQTRVILAPYVLTKLVDSRELRGASTIRSAATARNFTPVSARDRP